MARRACGVLLVPWSAHAQRARRCSPTVARAVCPFGLIGGAELLADEGADGASDGCGEGAPETRSAGGSVAGGLLCIGAGESAGVADSSGGCCCVEVAATAVDACIRAALFRIRRVSRISFKRPSSAVAPASLAVALASPSARLFALWYARFALFAGFVPVGFGSAYFCLPPALSLSSEEQSARACASDLGAGLFSRRVGSASRGGGGGGGGWGGGSGGGEAVWAGRWV
jgi:hypothetical protein